MPDSAIGDLPQAEYIDDQDKLLLEQGGAAMHIPASLLTEFINRNILGIRVSTLPAGSDVTGSYNAETGILTLGIPRSLGAVNSVDGVAVKTNGDVPLGALSYDRGQSLSTAQKSRARTNLGLTEAAVAALPLSLANGGLGTTSRAEAQEMILRARYIDGSSNSINSLTESGISRLLIHDGSDDAAYLGWSGYALVEVLGLGGSTYASRWMQRVTQMETGRCSVRYTTADDGWSYDIVWAYLSCAFTLAAGESKTIKLGSWKQYTIAAYSHTWIVDTRGSASAPYVFDLNTSGRASALTCTASEDGAAVTISNGSSSSSYQIFITQN